MVWHGMKWHGTGKRQLGMEGRCHANDVTCMSHPHLWELLTAQLIPTGTNLHGKFFCSPQWGKKWFNGGLYLTASLMSFSVHIFALKYLKQLNTNARLLTNLRFSLRLPVLGGKTGEKSHTKHRKALEMEEGPRRGPQPH